MPLICGKVLYCKFNKKINHDFPRTAWIEIGPLRKKGAIYLTKCKLQIPVFEKIKSNQWKYLGKALISDATNQKELDRLNKNPPREKIQMILRFKFS